MGRYLYHGIRDVTVFSAALLCTGVDAPSIPFCRTDLAGVAIVVLGLDLFLRRSRRARLRKSATHLPCALEDLNQERVWDEGAPLLSHSRSHPPKRLWTGPHMPHEGPAHRPLIASHS